MTTQENAINGILRTDSMYKELKEQIVEALSDRLATHLSDEVLVACFGKDEQDTWILIQSDLTQTALDVLEDFVGYE